jgi:hypothetical protein
VRLWWVIIFGVCFLIAGSITSGKFLPHTREGKVIAVVLVIFLALIIGWAIWVLLPYYSQ